MKIICNICGKHSKDSSKCTNCSSEIVLNDEMWNGSTSVKWGWATFSFSTDNLKTKEDIIYSLREKWESIEKFTIFHIINSQIYKLKTEAETIRVLTRKDFLSTITEYEGLFVKFEPLKININTAEEANKLLRNSQI